MKMKKIMSLGLCALLLVACGPKDDAQVENKTNSDNVASSTDTSEKADVVKVKTKLTGNEVEVEFPQPPKRVVSLAGFTTEMLLSLGLEDSMVGTAYLDNEMLPQYKEAYDKIPVLSDKNPSPEVLIDAKPDFVVGWSSSFSEKNFFADFLEKNGMKGFVPYSEHTGDSMEDVYQDYRTFGEIFGVEDKAEEVIGRIKGKIDSVQAKVKDKEPVRVFVYDSGEASPLTAGGGLNSDIIRLAGGENIFKDEDKSWFETQWETVLQANPEYILVMQYDASEDIEAKIDYVKNKSALKDSDAVKNNKIMVLGLSDLLPGERPADAIEKMAEAFHGIEK